MAYGLAFVFFALAPALGYPLTYADAINVLKIIVPVFAGYLGAAVLFFGSGEPAEASEPPSRMLLLLVRWPVLVFGLGMVALLIGFPLSNRSEYTGSGMNSKHTFFIRVSVDGVARCNNWRNLIFFIQN